jgi:hypothetical protein
MRYSSLAMQCNAINSSVLGVQCLTGISTLSNKNNYLQSSTLLCEDGPNFRMNE